MGAVPASAKCSVCAGASAAVVDPSEARDAAALCANRSFEADARVARSLLYPLERLRSELSSVDNLLLPDALALSKAGDDATAGSGPVIAVSVDVARSDESVGVASGSGEEGSSSDERDDSPLSTRMSRVCTMPCTRSTPVGGACVCAGAASGASGGDGEDGSVATGSAPSANA